MKTKYTLEAGRLIVRDGVPLATLHGVRPHEPRELDELAREVVARLNAQCAPKPRIKPVCSHCGSDDVKGDAYAVWDTERQTWEVAGGDVFDKGAVCEKCDGETRLKWVRA